MIGGTVFVSWYRSREAADRVEPASSPSSASSASAPFRNPVVWAVALLSGLAGVTSLATNTFLPSALKAVFHMDAVAAAALISTGFARAIALNLTFGFLMDRLNRSAVTGGVALLLHSPIFYVTGDKSDIACENGLDDFKRITKVPAIHTYKDGVSHGGTYSQPNGGDSARVAVAMPNWQLKGDKEASKMFVGANCGL